MCDKKSPKVVLLCFLVAKRTICSDPNVVITLVVTRPGGGGVLPIMAYTGRLCPKGVPFSGFRYMKG